MKKSYYQMFVEWFSWTKVGVIATIFVPIFIFVLQNYIDQGKDKDKDEPNEILTEGVIRDDVLEYVASIESSFSLEGFPLNIDTLKNPDVQMIKYFKILCLDFANRTRELYNTPNVSNFGNKSLDELLIIEKSWDEKMHNRTLCLEKLEKCMNDLESYGKEKNIDNYFINKSMYNDFLEAEDLVAKYSDEMRNQALIIYNNENKAWDESNKEALLQIIKLQEKSCKNINIYRRDNKLLKLLDTLNKNYDIQLKIIKMNS